jgi:hypothetical protein
MKMNRLLVLVALLGFAVVAQADNGTRWLTYPGGDGLGQGQRIVNYIDSGRLSGHFVTARMLLV